MKRAEDPEKPIELEEFLSLVETLGQCSRKTRRIVDLMPRGFGPFSLSSSSVIVFRQFDWGGPESPAKFRQGNVAKVFQP